MTLRSKAVCGMISGLVARWMFVGLILRGIVV